MASARSRSRRSTWPPGPVGRNWALVRRRAVYALGAGLAFVSSGCGGEDRQSGSSTTTALVAGPLGPTATSEPVSLSADQIRAVLLGDGPAGAVSEQIIVECMNDAGFEFFATEDDRGSDGFSAPEPTLEQVEQTGYGILIDPVETTMPTSEPDPNIAYRDSLSVTEQQAYEQVFSGGATNMAEIDPESCLGRQMAAIDAAAPPVPDQLYLEILSRFEALIDVDSAIVDARRQWTACMGDAGYSFASREDIIDYLFAIEDENGDSAATPTQKAEERTLAVTDFGCSEAERAAMPAAEGRAADQIIDEYGSGA